MTIRDSFRPHLVLHFSVAFLPLSHVLVLGIVFTLVRVCVCVRVCACVCVCVRLCACVLAKFGHDKDPFDASAFLCPTLS